jgi:hypothetical protein
MSVFDKADIASRWRYVAIRSWLERTQSLPGLRQPWRSQTSTSPRAKGCTIREDQPSPISALRTPPRRPCAASLQGYQCNNFVAPVRSRTCSQVARPPKTPLPCHSWLVPLPVMANVSRPQNSSNTSMGRLKVLSIVPTRRRGTRHCALPLGADFEHALRFTK